jgi:hypothetical protein
VRSGCPAHACARTPVQAVPAPLPHAHPGCSRAPCLRCVASRVALHLVLRVACRIGCCGLHVALYVASCMLHSCRFGCSGWQGRLRASSAARSTHPQRQPSPMRCGCLRRLARSTRSRQRSRISIPQRGATRVCGCLCVRVCAWAGGWVGGCVSAHTPGCVCVSLWIEVGGCVGSVSGFDDYFIVAWVGLVRRLAGLGWAPLQQLTRLGGTLARMPVHPLLGKMLLLSACFGCTDEILSGPTSPRFTSAPRLACRCASGGLQRRWQCRASRLLVKPSRLARA